MLRGTCRHPILITACALMALWLHPDIGRAGSTVPMDLPTLADHAGQVITGTVASVESYWAKDPTRIESRVVLTDAVYLKGQLPDSTDTFTLVVPGGTVGTTSMRIGCAPELTPGSRWILMLLPTYKTFPTVGLSQGAFLVEPDDTGTPRVYSASHDAIMGVTGGRVVQVARSAGAKPTDRIIGGSGARLIAPADEPSAVSYADFVAALAPILAASRDHYLKEPAGRRVPVRYTPTRMIRSRASGSGISLSARSDPSARPQPAADGNALRDRHAKERGTKR